MTLWSGALALCWLAGLWLWQRHWHAGWVSVVCLIAAILAHAAMWPRIAVGYAGDSFWTLGTGGRVGVLLISGIGLGLLFAALAAKTRVLRGHPFAIVWDGAIGLAAFALIYSVSPQAFYSLYRLVFDALPAQWVIDGPFNWPQIQRAIIIGAEGNLSDDLAGLVFWAIPAFTVWLHLRDGPR